MLNYHVQKSLSDRLNQAFQPHASSWIEISKSALLANIASYKKVLSNTILACVLKSNGYGHGIEQVAKICDASADVGMLCVVSLSEAVLLRQNNIKKPILVLSIIDHDLVLALLYDIELVVYDYATASTLSDLAQRLNKKVRVHIKIDTGLSRLGFAIKEAFAVIKMIYNLPNMSLVGLFTHLANAESIDQSYVDYQLQQFSLLQQELSAAGIDIPLKHASCSAAITSNSNSHFTLARMGIGLYGLWPSQENRLVTQTFYPDFTVQPVLTWKTKIIHIKEIAQGTPVGYDCTYRAARDMRIAIVPVGYWDGFDRKLSNKANILVNNQLAPVIGRISMNLTIIDVADVFVKVGDIVTLLGDYDGIRAEDLAHFCNTINYEIVTRINPLLPRIIVD